MVAVHRNRLLTRAMCMYVRKEAMNLKENMKKYTEGRNLIML